VAAYINSYNYRDTTSFNYNPGLVSQPDTVTNNNALNFPSTIQYGRIKTGDDTVVRPTNVFSDHVTWFNGVNFFVST